MFVFYWGMWTLITNSLFNIHTQPYACIFHLSLGIIFIDYFVCGMRMKVIVHKRNSCHIVTRRSDLNRLFFLFSYCFCCCCGGNGEENSIIIIIRMSYGNNTINHSPPMPIVLPPVWGYSSPKICPEINFQRN